MKCFVEVKTIIICIHQGTSFLRFVKLIPRMAEDIKNSMGEKEFLQTGKT